MPLNEVSSIGVSEGRWLRRLDNRTMTNGAPVPILAYGLDQSVLIVYDDGSHEVVDHNARFPSSNWEVWDV